MRSFETLVRKASTQAKASGILKEFFLSLGVVLGTNCRRSILYPGIGVNGSILGVQSIFMDNAEGRFSAFDCS